MRSLHILDTIARVRAGEDHYEGGNADDPYHAHNAFDDIDEELFPRHTRLG